MFEPALPKSRIFFSHAEKLSVILRISAEASLSLTGWLFHSGAFLCRTTDGNTNGLNLQAVLVHVEPLFPIQSLDEFACGLGYCTGKARRIQLDRRSPGTVHTILIAKRHFKCFHI